MRYYIPAFLLQLLLLHTLAAQPRTSHKWQIGGGIGTMGYWGDLNEDFISPSQGWVDKEEALLGYNAFLERLGTSGWGWRIYIGQGSFEANDRQIDWQGNLDTNAPLFGRGLNVRTKIREAGWQLVFRTDNGWLLGKRAFIAPYFAIGGGITHFRPYGDRFYDNGSRYYHWSDGSIRNLAQTPANTNTATIITPDNQYETALWQYDTEGEDYRNITWHASASVGLSFRISKRIGLLLEYNARYTGTDHLDDISGNYLANASENTAYLSNPTGWSGSRSTVNKEWFDAYHFATIGLRYRLGEKRSELDLPVIYHNEFAYPTVEASTETKEVPIRIVNTYFFPLTGLIAFDGQNNPIAWESSFAMPSSREKELTDSKQPPFQVQPVATSDTALVATSNTKPSATPVATVKEVSKNTTDSVSTTAKAANTEIVVEKKPAAGFSVVPVAEKEGKDKTSKEKTENKGRNTIAIVPSAKVTASSEVIDSLKNVTMGQQRQLDDLKSQLYAVQRSLPNYLPSTNVSVAVTTDSLAPQNAGGSNAAAGNMNALMRRVEALEFQLMQLRATPTTGTTNANTAGSESVVLQQLQQMNQQLQQLVQQNLNSQKQMQEAVQRLDGQTGKVTVVPAPVPVATTPVMAQAFAKTVVFFEVGSANLSTWSKDRLQAVGLFLSQNPTQKMLLRGYTDQTGSANANTKLANARANKAVVFLQQMGVSPTQITLDYTGPDLSLTDKNSSYGRRVELVKVP